MCEKCNELDRVIPGAKDDFVNGREAAEAEAERKGEAAVEAVQATPEYAPVKAAIQACRESELGQELGPMAAMFDEGVSSALKTFHETEVGKGLQAKLATIKEELRAEELRLARVLNQRAVTAGLALVIEEAGLPPAESSTNSEGPTAQAQ